MDLVIDLSRTCKESKIRSCGVCRAVGLSCLLRGGGTDVVTTSVVDDVDVVVVVVHASETGS